MDGQALAKAMGNAVVGLAIFALIAGLIIGGAVVGLAVWLL